jgi:hypothetical protein
MGKEKSSNVSIKTGIDVEFLFDKGSIKHYYNGMRICEISNDTIELYLMRKKVFDKGYTASNIWKRKWTDIERIIFDIVWEFGSSGGGTGIPSETIYSLSVNFVGSEINSVVISRDFACSKLLVESAEPYNIAIVDDKNIIAIADKSYEEIKENYAL